MVHQAGAKARMSGSLRTGPSIELPSYASGRNLRTLRPVYLAGGYAFGATNGAFAGNSTSTTIFPPWASAIALAENDTGAV
jgi:hypothetical protein